MERLGKLLRRPRNERFVKAITGLNLVTTDIDCKATQMACKDLFLSGIRIQKVLNILPKPPARQTYTITTRLCVRIESRLCASISGCQAWVWDG